MAIPDTSNDVEMAAVGRKTVLRKHRRDIARKLRDRIVPMLNSIEGDGSSWNVSGIPEMCDEINQINLALAELP